MAANSLKIAGIIISLLAVVLGGYFSGTDPDSLSAAAVGVFVMGVVALVELLMSRALFLGFSMGLNAGAVVGAGVGLLVVLFGGGTAGGLVAGCVAGAGAYACVAVLAGDVFLAAAVNLVVAYTALSAGAFGVAVALFLGIAGGILVGLAIKKASEPLAAGQSGPTA